MNISSISTVVFCKKTCMHWLYPLSRMVISNLLLQLFDKLAANGFKMAPDCSTTWITDFLYETSPNLKEFENLTCSLNWTKIGIEMSKYDADMAEYNEEVG